MNKQDLDVSREGGRLTADHEEDVMVRGSQFGSLGAVVTETLSGIKDIKAEDFVPPVVGAGGAIAGSMAATKWGGKISPRIPEYAPLVGGVVGALASVPLGWWKGSQAALQGMVASIVFGTGIWAYQKLQQRMMLGGVVVRPYGAFEAQPIRGMLPQVTDSGQTPQAVAQQMDPAAFGQVP